MKSLINDFKQQIEKILEGMDLLVEYGFVPSRVNEKEITKTTIDEQKDNLDKERFIVSVCGQIKAGKSTLLNYLLFNGDNILPTDVLPWTAKITKIYYGNKSCIKIHYYSKALWDDLKSSVIETGNRSISYYDEFLKHELEVRAKKGIKETDKIGITPLTETIEDIKKINNYVSKEGNFTPFVDHVEIILNNEFIKDVILVDTPGLNDPNPYRSNLTKEFIDKSNAVIYLMHSNQPLSRSDLEFIDKYLSHIPSDRLLFVLSQCDNILDDVTKSDSVTKVLNFVELNLKSRPEIKERRLLEGRNVLAISTMAAIISKKTTEKLPLTEDEEFHKNRIPEYLIKNEGSLPDMVKAIEQNIMSDKGDALIQSSKQRIAVYCNTKINELKSKINLLSDQLESLSMSKSEIEKKELVLENVRLKIDIYKRERNNELRSLLAVDKNKRYLKLMEMKVEVKKDFNIWLDSQYDVNSLRDYSQYKIQQFTNTKLLNFFISGTGKELVDNLSDFQTDTKSGLKDLSNSVLDSRWVFLFAPIIDLQSISRLITNHFEGLNREYLEQLKAKKLIILNDLQGSRRNFEMEIYKSLDFFFDNTLIDNLTSIINREAESFIESITGNLDKALYDLQGSLNSLKDSTLTICESEIDINHQLSDFEEMIKIKNKQSKEILDLIGV
jgi:GTPase Era involved in 16S rRNA processing